MRDRTPWAMSAMPKLKPDTQQARREHILDAAERCFARAGFHRSTMQDICKEAGVSPGAIYVYFASKEDLIAGLCERDRAEFAQHFGKLAEAPDFLVALNAIGEHYLIEEAVERQRVVVEMGIESTRNPQVHEIHSSVDKFCRQSFQDLFRRQTAEGRMSPKVGIEELAAAFQVIGDGLFWRRAVDPDFNPRKVLPVLTEMLAAILNPQPAGQGAPDAEPDTQRTVAAGGRR